MNTNNEKVILILADGLRPDAMRSCGHPYVEKFLSESSFDMNTQAVYPSVTLPCHMSLFHSVDPKRHGILTNTYTPQVRPINGLCEQLKAAQKTCAFFYNWEELRDLSRPSSLAYSFFASGDVHTYPKANEMVTEAALSYIGKEHPDFAFVYLGLTDSAGHCFGWMGPEYMDACRFTMDELEKLTERFKDEYHIIFTADHGGHDRSHGSTDMEDMLIPLVLRGRKNGSTPNPFTPGRMLTQSHICDIAPTITALMGTNASKDWEGKSLI